MADATTGHEGRLDLEALFHRERDRLHAMCLAILRDEAEAEDAVQETFVRVASRLDALDGDPVAYIIVVARNVCRAELRRRAHRATQSCEPSCGGATPEDAAVARGLLRLVWRQLARVEQALLTDVFRGLSMAEIAARDGSTSDAVAQRLSRLRRRIRHMVAAPAALLVPMLRAGAEGRALLQRLRPGGLVVPLLNRLHAGESALMPMLVGVAAGMVVLPAPAAMAQAPSRHTPTALTAPLAAPAAALTTPPGLPQAIRSARAALSSPRPVAQQLRTLLHPPPDASFYTFTPSPSYRTDRVVFASAGGPGCSQPQCAVLWRSDDAGATWKPLEMTGPGASVPGFQIILPPSWPTDPTMYTYSNGSLYRSDDGGLHFHEVAGFPGPSIIQAALDPTSQPGNTRILMLQGTWPSVPLVYTEADNQVRRLSGLPTDATSIVMLAVPSGPEAYFYVQEAVGPGGLYSCPATASTCSRVGPYVNWYDSAMSPTFDADHTSFTSNGSALDISASDTGSITSVPLPYQGVLVVSYLPAADYARSHLIDLVIRLSSGEMRGVRVVDGSAHPWSGVLRTIEADSMARLPDGRLIVGLQHTADFNTRTYSGGGTLCSADDGATWAAC